MPNVKNHHHCLKRHLDLLQQIEKELQQFDPSGSSASKEDFAVLHQIMDSCIQLKLQAYAAQITWTKYYCD